MGRNSNGSPVVATRNCFANSRPIMKDADGEPIKDKKGNVVFGLTMTETLNGIRQEVETFLDLGELDMAANQINGLKKLELRFGYYSWEKLTLRLEACREALRVNKNNIRLQYVEESKARRLERERLHRDASFAEANRQKEEGEKRAQFAREEREIAQAEAIAQRQLKRLAKDDREVWMAHHNDLDNDLTHSPFGALIAVKATPAPVVVEVAPVVAVVKAVSIDEIVEVDAVLKAFNEAIAACEAVGQLVEVKDLLGDEFFAQAITVETVKELHEAMELVVDNS